MGWTDDEPVRKHVRTLQLLADYKYDHYQRFAPGKRFIESLALWLDQFDQQDRTDALDFVLNRLVFFSEAEFSHIVQTAYPDLIVQERMRLVAEEHGLAPHKVAAISAHPRFKELQLKSLYLGLSDGARTNEFRRGAGGEIGNEQIWQAYELGQEKAKDMLEALRDSLDKNAYAETPAHFNVVWLVDDFSASGNTYIRFDHEKRAYKGKIKKIYSQLHNERLVDPSHYEIYLLLYAATQQAIDHIEYWSERFSSENGYKPLQVRVLCPIARTTSVTVTPDPGISRLLANDSYCDQRASDKHFRVGGTTDVRRGFAGCALPVVLSHNTPNNSVYLLWGPETFDFFGLFPRVSRHREF